MALTWGRPDVANVGGRFHEGRVINTNARNTGLPVAMEGSNGDSTGQSPNRPDLNVDIPGSIF